MLVLLNLAEQPPPFGDAHGLSRWSPPARGGVPGTREGSQATLRADLRVEEDENEFKWPHAPEGHRRGLTAAQLHGSLHLPTHHGLLV